MDDRRRKESKQPSGTGDWARPPETPNPNKATDGAGVDAIRSASCRLAQWYLSPLANLFALSLKLDDLVGVRWAHDAIGWRQGIVSVVEALRDAKLRLQAIEPAARMALRCRGGQGQIVADAEAELSARAAAAYDHHASVKALVRKSLEVMGQRMATYGTKFPEVGLSEEEERIFITHCQARAARPRSDRRAAGGTSQAITVYIGPIEGLARALDREDVTEIVRELGRVNENILERLERRLAEIDSITSSGPVVNAALRRELNRRNYDLKLEECRVSLIDKAAAGMLRCFGGTQRLAMEMTLRDSTELEAPPADARVEAILDRVSNYVMEHVEPKRAEDE